MLDSEDTFVDHIMAPYLHSKLVMNTRNEFSVTTSLMSTRRPKLVITTLSVIEIKNYDTYFGSLVHVSVYIVKPIVLICCFSEALLCTCFFTFYWLFSFFGV